MRIPEFIDQTGCLGLVAPSYGCNIEPYKTAFQNAQKKWKEMGFSLDLGPNCYAGSGIGISNTPQKCAGEINSYFSKAGVDALISCGGGELMCEILDYVDFGKLAEEEPKWFMGYSDNTNLTFLLATLCDTAAVYGPCAAAFGMEPWHSSLQDAMDLLMGKKDRFENYSLWEKTSLKDEAHPLEPYHVTEKTVIRRFPDQDVVLEGRLLGGCLDCLRNLAGSEYDRTKAFARKYRSDGIIWYLEACDLNIMDIRRAVWQLQHAGWFDHAEGFLIGRPMCFGQEMFGLDQYRAVTDLLSCYHVPVLMDLDIGHLAPMMPLVNGACARVVSEGEHLSIQYDFKN
ncbi:MAG: LD-carboxypeptidase [Clostridiaceae bacterium]|nr:LD-carboxypeptidase [Clostridiaceae bacterium]